ncbi:HAMP domain-containing sensor histidine kinase [Gottfriedia acidiceleris]|uniref:histidine kinase n=1 Tax=Gottfriedia acidiceleris TaxID=371036 RepID=A0ABY4JG49_9BACI|nr:HAMP domain-containing sensor histidine kinase [Gottfriedia acidiceleris]UPM52812.1 HAMP domain-containing histidine kinase [Gottfriedia acidiceleris]
MKNLIHNWQRISIKLLVAITISFGVSLIVTIFISQIFIGPYFVSHQNKVNSLQYNLIIIPTFVMIILSFIISFLLLIRKKILYLKEISSTVQLISQGKLGAVIELKGRDELTQLSMNINTMSKELEQKFKNERHIENVKNELITSVSHDLRTPLTSILGYSNLLKNREYKNENELYEYLNTIYTKSHDLKNLINELFEFTRLSSPDIILSKQKVDLSQLIEQIIGENIPIFQKEGLNIKKESIAEDIEITIDVEKMVRVFDNLFMNAMKYSVKPSTIKVSLTQTSNEVLLSISNHSINVNPASLERFFEKFYREDSSRKSEGSAGLGLAITKRIVELHKGSIWVELKDDWITFFVKLNKKVL